MFKVGDKVKIRKDLNVDFCYDGIHPNGDFIGKEVIIDIIIDKKTFKSDGVWFSFKMIQDKIEDKVNHPDHYKGNKGIETIDYIENIMSEEAFEGYLVGNITKYISRFDKKNGLEDIKKAQWYINKLIEKMEER